MAVAVDLLDLIKEHAGGQFTRKARTHGGEYAGPCPWCGGTDRFMVWPGDSYPHYWCRGCGERGGVAAFLWKRCNVSWPDARRVEQENLSIDEARPGGQRAEQGSSTPPSVTGAPSLEWQAQAFTLMRLAATALWSPDADPRVLRYLTGKRRGLAPETIKARRLGYIPEDLWMDAEQWGIHDRDVKKVFVPRGILIPYESEGQIWRLKIRRLTGDKQHRYIAVYGSANALYDADSLAYGRAASLSEGEFDAMIGGQEAPELAHCATGGTDGAHQDRWVARLALAESVLVTFDPDQGGEERAAWWTARLRNAARLRPVGGDLTVMHVAGQVPLGAWFNAATERARKAMSARDIKGVPEIPPTQQEPATPDAAALVGPCFWCKAPGSRWADFAKRPWCAAHAPEGAVDCLTGEVFTRPNGTRDMSVGSGLCYWCGDPAASVDPHGRPWCERHRPDEFDGNDPGYPEEDLGEEPEGRIYENEEIAEILRASLVELGADYSEERPGAPASPATAQEPRRKLPDAPRCTATGCKGQDLSYDCLGNPWCRVCGPRREMVNAGAEAGWFPDLRWGTTQRTGAGGDNWVGLARTLSRGACAMVIRAARGEPLLILAHEGELAPVG